MSYSHRFFLWAPVTILAALAIAAGAYWFVSAGKLSRYLDAMNGKQIAPGVQLSFTKKQMAGFPFRLDVILDNAAISAPGSHGPIKWSAEHFAMHMLDYGRVQAIYEAAGKQTITWTGENGAKKQLSFVPALLRASSINKDGRLSRFDFELIGAAAKDLKIANLQFHLRRAPDADALDIAFNADDVHLSPDYKSAFGNAIKRIHLDARMKPASVWTAFLSGKSDWRKAAEDWRTHDGALDIANLDVAWGKMDAAASGELMLDDMQRPRGILNLHVTGVQTLAAQMAHGQPNGIFSGILNAIAQTPQNAQAKVDIRLAFKDGVGYVFQTPAGILTSLY